MAGYRSKVATIAKAFGLRGYVRNLPDGRVKILAEGPKEDLDRFLGAIKIENALIKVEEIQAEFSEGSGAYDDFLKAAGEHETDARLDVAAEHLKELIVAVKEGFKETGSKLGSMESSLKEISGKQDELIVAVREGFKETGSKLGSMDSKLDEISGKQDELIVAIREGFKGTDSRLNEISGKQDELIDTTGDVLSEVKGLRSDLKGRTEKRLQKIESDVVAIKARMKA